MIKAPLQKHLYLQALWLINVRWFIGVGVTLFVLFIYLLQIIELKFFCLSITALFILIINVVYYSHLKHILKINFESNRQAVVFNINSQISIDFIILTVFIHLSGGIENPILIFYVFHMIIGSIILTRKSAFLQSLLAIFLFCTLTIMEHLRIIPHYSLNSHISAFVFSNQRYLIFSLLVFSATSVLIVYFTSTLASRLRHTQSELRVLNVELKRKNDIKNEYVQRLTHNIKGDLSTINICLNVVKSLNTDYYTEQHKTFVDKAYNRTKRLMKFVEDLLILTNMRLNKRFDTVEFNINEMLTNVVELSQIYAATKNIYLSLDVPDNQINIMGVKVSIHEALFNVVQNALKYTQENGIVKVMLVKKNEKIKITISDTGMGIPAEALPHIFDEFFRADNAVDKEGTGLGLALVKAIINRHSGEISVESELNKGSVFTILLFSEIKKFKKPNKLPLNVGYKSKVTEIFTSLYQPFNNKNEILSSKKGNYIDSIVYA